MHIKYFLGNTSSVLVTYKEPVPTAVTEKTPVHEPVDQKHYEHPHIGPKVVAGVAVVKEQRL